MNELELKARLAMHWEMGEGGWIFISNHMIGEGYITEAPVDSWIELGWVDLERDCGSTKVYTLSEKFKAIKWQPGDPQICPQCLHRGRADEKHECWVDSDT